MLSRCSQVLATDAKPPPAQVKDMEGIAKMSGAATRDYCSHYQIVYFSLTDALRRDAIAQNHLDKPRFIPPTAAAPPDFAPHSAIVERLHNYTSIEAFDMSYCFSNITPTLSGGQSIRDGTGSIGGNSNATIELPNPNFTVFQGNPLNNRFKFLLANLVSFSGIGSFERYVRPGITASDQRRYRFTAERGGAMRCSLFGCWTYLSPARCNNHLAYSLNNYSLDRAHFEPCDHHHKRVGFVARFANVMQLGYPCLPQSWNQAVRGTLRALSLIHTHRETYQSLVRKHTRNLLEDNTFCRDTAMRMQSAYLKDDEARRPLDDRSLGTRAGLSKWLREVGLVCEVSGILIHPCSPSPFQLHPDRINDDIAHNKSNINVRCQLFCSTVNPSKEQWLQVILEQDMVRLTGTERALVTAELARLAAGNMTPKHAYRTR